MMKNPKDIAGICVNAGVAKGNLPLMKMFLLAILAGVYIAFGGMAATIIPSTIENASVAKFVGGCVFPGGLAMVLVAGAELFTGNNLMITALMQKKITGMQMLRNLVVVYIGNLVGGILVAAMVVYSHIPGLFGGQVAQTAVNTGIAKVSMSFGDAMIRGIVCNILVCVAVWMSFSAATAISKIAALYFPIMIFVSCGFEHSVANMFYGPAGILAAAEYGIEAPGLTWGSFFLNNLLPVTIGNMIGGFGLGLIYWYVYLKEDK